MNLSELSIQDVGRALAAAIPFLVAVVGLSRGPGAARTRLQHDVDLLEKLPPGSEARVTYEKYLAAQVRQFASFETTASRDTPDAVLSLLLVLGLLYGAVEISLIEGWGWDVLAATMALMAIAGISVAYEALERVPRDEKKKRLKPESRP